MNTVDINWLIAVAKEAGAAIMGVYGGAVQVEEKGDGSPLTLADRLANEKIVTALRQKYPEIPILSEETKAADYEERKTWQRLWVVDPLDGTKEFIKQNGEFTVNIALVENGTPVLGVVFAPALGVIYYSDGQNSYKKTVGGTPQKLPLAQEARPYKVVASRSHNTPETETLIETMRYEHPDLELVSIGSSLKLCLVAEGSADLYPRLAPTMEWDTAAAHAVAIAAGKTVSEHQSGQPLRYNKPDLLNPWFVVR